MKRGALVAVLVVAVALATVPAGGLAQSGSTGVAPGERFAGVVGVQGAELDGEVATRALSARLARADGDAARAAVVATEVNDTRQRLRELERRRDRLRTARENGSISEGQYRARVARLVAEARTLRHRLNRTADASRDLPDAALRERGVDPAAIERLRGEADGLTGPETAAIARGITGDDGPAEPGGVPPGRDDASDRGRARGTETGSGSASGPSDRAESGSDRPERPNGPRNRSEGPADRREQATNGSADRTPTGQDGAVTDGEPTDRAENESTDRAGNGSGGPDAGGDGATDESRPARGTEDGSAPPRGSGDDGDAADGRADGKAGGSNGTDAGSADPDGRPGAGERAS